MLVDCGLSNDIHGHVFGVLVTTLRRIVYYCSGCGNISPAHKSIMSAPVYHRENLEYQHRVEDKIRESLSTYVADSYSVQALKFYWSWHVIFHNSYHIIIHGPHGQLTAVSLPWLNRVYICTICNDLYWRCGRRRQRIFMGIEYRSTSCVYPPAIAASTDPKRISLMVIVMSMRLLV